MATANELFAANGEDYIVIDSDLRTMTFPASVNNIGVENDKDVHKLNFKMPRYFSGYDLSEFTIHINYVNANGDADMYYVLDPTINENEIIFSWLVGRHACLYRGSVTFIVCLKLADGEGDVAQEYNTTLASLQVLPGLETEPAILETEHDIIEQLLLSINDTNAKIKAVLDTGLTPEQIAEFYNRSKNYDTEIAAINSNIVAIPSTANKRLLYVFDTDCNLLTQEWVLGGGNNFPPGERFWYIHSIAYVTDSDGVITIGKQIAYAYSSDISYERLCKNSTWSDWVQTPSRAELDALNSRYTVKNVVFSDLADGVSIQSNRSYVYDDTIYINLCLVTSANIAKKTVLCVTDVKPIKNTYIIGSYDGGAYETQWLTNGNIYVNLQDIPSGKYPVFIGIAKQA